MPAAVEPLPELRAFRRRDPARVQALIFRTIDACYAGVYPAAAVAFFKQYHSRENIAADARNGCTLVLELRGRIVGVGTLVRTTIKRVFVEPEFQHCGYGRLLVARLEAEARKRGVTVVDLDASLPSRRLYNFLGYQAGRLSRIAVGTGQALKYYPMTKTLGRLARARLRVRRS